MDQSSSFLIELGFVFVFNIQNNRPSFQLWPDELSSGLLCPPSDHSFLSFWHCQSDPEIYEISSLLDIMSNTLQKPTWASPASFQLRISFISFGFSFFRFFGILSWTSLRVWKKWIGQWIGFKTCSKPWGSVPDWASQMLILLLSFLPVMRWIISRNTFCKV